MSVEETSNQDFVLSPQAQTMLSSCFLLLYSCQQAGALEDLRADLLMLVDKYLERRRREIEVGER